MGLGSLVGSIAKTVVNVLTVPVGAVVGFQSSLRIACHRQPMPMPHQFSRYLEHPLRMSYRNPRELLTQCGIASGETALDLGCGIGTFTIEMARMVGERGTIHAIDIQKPLLDSLAPRLAGLGLLGRTHLHLASAQGIPLPDQSVNMVTLIATLGEIADPLVAVDEVYRVLKPGGRLVVSEELLDPGYVSAQTAQRWLTDAGFELSSHVGTPFCYVDLFLRPR